MIALLHKFEKSIEKLKKRLVKEAMKEYKSSEKYQSDIEEAAKKYIEEIYVQFSRPSKGRHLGIDISLDLEVFIHINLEQLLERELEREDRDYLRFLLARLETMSIKMISYSFKKKSGIEKLSRNIIL